MEANDWICGPVHAIHRRTAPRLIGSLQQYFGKRRDVLIECQLKNGVEEHYGCWAD